MTQTHDIFLRAYAVAAKEKTKQKNPKHKKQIRNSPAGDELKWAQRALVFDTETRITADQSLTFGVYRLCKLVADIYTVTEEGVFYADDLPAKERRVLESHIKTAVSDVASFPPRFPLYSRSEFIKKVFWPAIKHNGALVCGLNVPFDLARLALAWSKGLQPVACWTRQPRS
jgi:hypothetical protein